MEGYNLEQIFRKRGETPMSKWFYIFVLLLSFMWCSFFMISNEYSGYYFTSYGRVFDFSSSGFFYEFVTLISIAVIYVFAFEIVLFLYRFIISFKIYSYVVPAERFKADVRIAYAFRNLFFGIYMNLCFLYPYLYSYQSLVGLFCTMVMVLVFARKIYKTYSEPLIAHFVFKTFVYPIFFFEVAKMIFTIGGLI